MSTHFFTTFIKSLLLALLIISNFNCTSQDIESEEEAKERREQKIERNKALSIFATIDLTYTGYSTVIGLEYEKRKHSFYLGPKISITNTYLFNKGPLGAVGGYKYFFLSDLKRWKVFANLDYQVFIFKAYEGVGNPSNHKNFIQEINLSYGTQFQITPRFFISNSIGVGKYFESYYSFRNGDRVRLHGYNALLRILLKYKL